MSCSSVSAQSTGTASATALPDTVRTSSWHCMRQEASVDAEELRAGAVEESEGDVEELMKQLNAMSSS